MNEEEYDEYLLTLEQRQSLDGMVERRMDNAGETREEAAKHIADYLIEV